METTFEITYEVNYTIIDKRGRERRYNKSFTTPEEAIAYAKAKDESHKYMCVTSVYKREHWETPYHKDPDGTIHCASGKSILTNIQWWE